MKSLTGKRLFFIAGAAEVSRRIGRHYQYRLSCVMPEALATGNRITAAGNDNKMRIIISRY
ncbi:hypothetical protein KCP75_00360 [Salmonella enterica subsp. enterica]|nr:hypothetical protein KCP75_00360 [Salmonella enterica subsp. enterica]